MRTAVYETVLPSNVEKKPSDIVPGIWSEYAPRTNIVWLLFLLKSLLKNRKPDLVFPPDLQTEQKGKGREPLAPRSVNSYRRMDNDIEAAGIVKATLQRSTHTAAGSVEPIFQVSVFKKALEERMLSVLELLDLDHGSPDMCCAADLVVCAIDKGWLDEKDFF